MNGFFDGVFHTIPLLELLLASFRAIPGSTPVEHRLLGTVPKNHVKVGYGMDAPACGLPSCVACDLAPKLKADTDCEAVDWGPFCDIQVQCIETAYSESFPDIQGQHRKGSRRSSPPSRL